MMLLTEKYDPFYVRFISWNKNYSSTYERRMVIQREETQLSIRNNVVGGLFISGVTTLALATTWLTAFLGVLLILSWMIFPTTRPIVRKRLDFLRQKGKDDYAYHRRYGPAVSWDLAERNPIYREAVVEWLDAVRQANSLDIKDSEWRRYLRETEVLVAKQMPELAPNFEKLKILREIMK